MASRSGAPLAAYVLHRYDWSESSLILDLFTREQGRLAVAAKGARRPHSQLRAVLLPFQRVQVTLTRAASDDAAPPEVQTLRSAEFGGGAPMPSGAALFPGFYLNELLMKLLARHDPHPALFDAYAHTLPRLGAADEQAALRAFELVLLRETGVLPDLGVVTATQQPLDDAGRYALHAERGLVPAGAAEAALDGRSWRALQAALDAGDIDALRAACFATLPALRTLLRNALHYHLGSSPLRTRQVLLELHQPTK
ncbi:MAG TPA: DNA repair protein RecO [Ideonella sp.]|nr:DNA repair protein RecO [Ideonella sp.]